MRFALLLTIATLFACAHEDKSPEYCHRQFQFIDIAFDLNHDGVVNGADFGIWTRECGD